MSDSFLVNPASRLRPDGKQRRVAVTGAAGRIGTYFAENSPERFDLLLLDHPDADRSHLEPHGEVAACDLRELQRLKELLDGVDTVLHLAAEAGPATTWGPLLESNFVGTYNAFVAAEAARCRRVVFASSIHAVSGYPAERQVQAADPVSPGDLYGVSKCFGEAMARFLSTQHGLSAICVRIGAFQPVDKAREADALPLMNAFVSRRDLQQLLVRCIDDERLQFAIVHGLSNNRFNRMDVSEARELLGYEPQDDFTELNRRLGDLDLSGRVHPHSERGGQASGIREELGGPGNEGGV